MCSQTPVIPFRRASSHDDGDDGDDDEDESFNLTTVVFCHPARVMSAPQLMLLNRSFPLSLHPFILPLLAFPSFYYSLILLSHLISI